MNAVRPGSIRHGWAWLAVVGPGRAWPGMAHTSHSNDPGSLRFAGLSVPGSPKRRSNRT